MTPEEREKRETVLVWVFFGLVVVVGTVAWLRAYGMEWML